MQPAHLFESLLFCGIVAVTVPAAIMTNDWPGILAFWRDYRRAVRRGERDYGQRACVRLVLSNGPGDGY